MEKFDIDIAGLSEPMEIRVNTREEKANYIAAANDVNHLFSAWSQRFTGKADKEILAMIALRLAYVNVERNLADKKRLDALSEIEKEIDSILL
ncbi:MAG: cell division protein ZapA [Muribaculaceae bacterium]